MNWISLQGVTLTEELIATMCRIAMPLTKLVWITSHGVLIPLQPYRILRVPFTHTEVLVFRLDQS
jgi:hypothetical protein